MVEAFVLLGVAVAVGFGLGRMFRARRAPRQVPEAPSSKEEPVPPVAPGEVDRSIEDRIVAELEAWVEVEVLVFARDRTAEALERAGRQDIAKALHDRPELLRAYDMVLSDGPPSDGHGDGESPYEVTVPGLMEIICPSCARRYRGSSLRFRPDVDPRVPDVHAVCPIGHILPGLSRKRLR